MGGLLAAEAATSPSNNPDEYPGARPRRIVALVAFDCPYLGMHPHVVITGIASLFPKDDDKKVSEAQLNNPNKVNIVDEKVTDDWDAFKRRLDAHSPRPSLSPPSQSNQTLSTNSSSVDHSRSISRSPSPSSLIDRALNFMSTHGDDPFIRWARKHRDDPVGAGKRWVIERFQFGICMFDPVGLRERYANLVAWHGGLWMNYWTQTRSKTSGNSNEDEEGRVEVIVDNDAALLETGIVREPSHTSDLQSKQEIEAVNANRHGGDKKKGKGKKKGKKPGRHFIVLPTGLGSMLGGGEKWERVLIEGVEDEVTAHCGLFIPGQNLDYQGLVERVGTRILEWCEKIQERTE